VEFEPTIPVFEGQTTNGGSDFMRAIKYREMRQSALAERMGDRRTAYENLKGRPFRKTGGRGVVERIILKWILLK
jgi:hypothetical protein